MSTFCRYLFAYKSYKETEFVNRIKDPWDNLTEFYDYDSSEKKNWNWNWTLNLKNSKLNVAIPKTETFCRYLFTYKVTGKLKHFADIYLHKKLQVNWF